jgi:hypothetical protein
MKLELVATDLCPNLCGSIATGYVNFYLLFIYVACYISFWPFGLDFVTKLWAYGCVHQLMQSLGEKSLPLSKKTPGVNEMTYRSKNNKPWCRFACVVVQELVPGNFYLTMWDH